MSEQSHDDQSEPTPYDKLSADLGIDVDSFTDQLRLRRDLARIHAGKTPEMGFVCIERENHPNAIVAFDSPEAAAAARNNHPLIEDLCQEDCLECYIPEKLNPCDLANVEVILA